MSISKKKVKGFSDEERAAMVERYKELKEDAKGDSVVLAKVNAMPEPDRAIGKKLHTIVRKNAPKLIPKLWYGMPAYANKEGKVVIFYQYASKFKNRYGTFNFTDLTKLDEGNFWPIGFGVMKLTPADEARIAALVKKAVS